MTIHPNDQPRTATTPPDRGMGWGIPVIVIAGVVLAGLFAYKSLEGHTGTTIAPISRADRSPAAPSDAPTPLTLPGGPGGKQ